MVLVHPFQLSFCDLDKEENPNSQKSLLQLPSSQVGVLGLLLHCWCFLALGVTVLSRHLK